LQWLDCVHQLMTQFPIFFEFSQGYLIKLVQHTYSNLYGTFLCNTQKQRSSGVLGKTFSVWEFLNAPSFRNHLYAPSTTSAGRVNKLALSYYDFKLNCLLYRFYGRKQTSEIYDYGRKFILIRWRQILVRRRVQEVPVQDHLLRMVT